LTAERDVTRVLLSKENLFVFTDIRIHLFKLDFGEFTFVFQGEHILHNEESVEDAVSINDEIWLG
jgi:hypothetical protein